MSPITPSQQLRFEPVGRHLIHLDGDTIFLIVRGPLTRPDVQELFAAFRRVQVEYGRLFIFYDAREAGGIEADARRYAATVPTTIQEADLQVVFGLSFGLRTVLNMVLRAQKLLHNRTANFHLFDTEENARAFFEAERERLRLEKKR